MSLCWMPMEGRSIFRRWLDRLAGLQCPECGALQSFWPLMLSQRISFFFQNPRSRPCKSCGVELRLVDKWSYMLLGPLLLLFALALPALILLMLSSWLVDVAGVTDPVLRPLLFLPALVWFVVSAIAVHCRLKRVVVYHGR